MARIMLTYILPLLLPTAMYFVWVSWVRNQIRANRAKAKAEGREHVEGDHTEPEDFDIKTPWFRLIFAGVVLMTVSLVGSVIFGVHNPPGSVYQAPYEKQDGTIQPGEYVPKPN